MAAPAKRPRAVSPPRAPAPSVVPGPSGRAASLAQLRRLLVFSGKDIPMLNHEEFFARYGFRNMGDRPLPSEEYRFGGSKGADPSAAGHESIKQGYGFGGPKGADPSDAGREGGLESIKQGYGYGGSKGADPSAAGHESIKQGYGYGGSKGADPSAAGHESIKQGYGFGGPKGADRTKVDQDRRRHGGAIDTSAIVDALRVLQAQGVKGTPMAVYEQLGSPLGLHLAMSQRLARLGNPRNPRYSPLVAKLGYGVYTYVPPAAAGEEGGD